MNARGFAWDFARSKQSVNPSEVFADCSFALNLFLYASGPLRSSDVINKTIFAKINACLPQSFFQLSAFVAQHRAAKGIFERLFLFGILVRHKCISTENARHAQYA